MTTTTDAIRALRTEDPDRDYLVVTHRISRDLYYTLSEMLASGAKRRKCTVFLTTYGGDPDAGFRIARALRHHYKDHLRVVVPSWCKSAGTLVAIAADELAIGDFGELGPLDIQVQKGTELQERSSGLDIIEAIGAVTDHAKITFHDMLREARGMGLSTKLSAEFAAHVSSAVAGPLFAQIDPMRLGELQRAMKIAHEYGKRLDKYAKNLKDGALETLIKEYPSHGFVIDRKEAQDLFHRVLPPSPAEKQFSQAFWELLQIQRELVAFLPELNELQGDDNEGSELQGEGGEPEPQAPTGAEPGGEGQQSDGSEPAPESGGVRTHDAPDVAEPSAH